MNKARIVIAESEWKKIEWFTNNYDREIAAFGKVKIRKDELGKYFYVYKLLFPKQETTEVTIKIKPEGWEDIIKAEGLEGTKDICFYWHRHPYSAVHSQTDEEETFGVLADKYAKYYLFLQTAVGMNGVWNEEARIEINNPIRAVITNEMIEVMTDSKEDKEIETECQKIIEKCVIKSTPILQHNTTLTNWNNWENRYETTNNYFKNRVEDKQYNSDIYKGGYSSVREAVLNNFYGFIIDDTEMNNTILKEIEPKNSIEIKFEKGQATIDTGEAFKSILLNLLTSDKNNELKLATLKWKESLTENPEITRYNLQPNASSYKKLVSEISNLYLKFMGDLQRNEDKKNKEPEIEMITDDCDLDLNVINETDTMLALSVNNDEVYDLLIEIIELLPSSYEGWYDFDISDSTGEITVFSNGKMVGSINDYGGKIEINGTDVIEIFKMELENAGIRMHYPERLKQYEQLTHLTAEDFE